MIITRTITALILLLVLLAGVLWVPNSIFALITLAIISVAGVEWAKLVNITNRFAAFSYGFSIFLIGFTFWYVMPSLPAEKYAQFSDTIMTIMLPFWFVLVPLTLFSSGWARFPLTMALSGFLVLLSSWLALVWLKEISLAWFFLPLLTVWISDITAFFVGRRFGRHKLAETISPKKSWEGAIAAIIIVSVLGTVSFMFFGDLLQSAQSIPLWQVPVAFSILTIMGIIGDLFESKLKRRANVKDSGTILPGHGGILDRIDALLPVLPIIAWLSYRVVSPASLSGLMSWLS